MNDLRISKKRNKYVILNYSDNRKQIGKGVTNKTEAKQLLTQLIADVATKKVIVSDRYKFKEEYLKYSNWRLGIAEDKTRRLSKGSIQGYGGNYHKYIEDCFPDVYVDQVDGSLLEEFVIKLNEEKKDTFTGQSMWKKSKDLIYKIKTFLRYADGKKMNVDRSVFNWHMKDQYHLQPEDDELFYPLETTPIMPDEVNRLLVGLLKNRNKDFKSFYKLMTVAGFLFTALRYSELLGIQKKHVDLINSTIWIGGVYDHRENRYKNKTKKKASKRNIDIQDDFHPILTEWMKKINHLDNPWLFPSLKTKGPISGHSFRSMLWMVFEEYGLAKLKWKVVNKNNINGKRNPGNRGITKSFTIVSSPFKNCPTKTFRHSLATHLVNAVKSDRNLDTNYIKNVLGHGDYKTTENIYGNHVMRVTDEERAARRKAVQKAMKINVAVYFNKQKLIKK
jgi:integrase